MVIVKDCGPPVRGANRDGSGPVPHRTIKPCEDEREECIKRSSTGKNLQLIQFLWEFIGVRAPIFHPVHRLLCGYAVVLHIASTIFHSHSRAKDGLSVRANQAPALKDKIFFVLQCPLPDGTIALQPDGNAAQMPCRFGFGCTVVVRAWARFAVKVRY